MPKEKMTIHRALAELKLIDSRIAKAILDITPTGVMQKDKLINGFYKKEDFETDARAKYQSVVDLIDRKNKIKSAIVMINGATKLTVANKEMTIADAINMKAVVVFKKQIVSELLKKHNAVKAKYISENEKVNNVALENAKIMIGKQGDDRVKATDDDVKAIVEPFVARNEFHLVDPLGVEKLTDGLQNEITAFESDVDAALSEINAITIIEF